MTNKKKPAQGGILPKNHGPLGDTNDQPEKVIPLIAPGPVKDARIFIHGEPLDPRTIKATIKVSGSIAVLNLDRVEAVLRGLGVTNYMRSFTAAAPDFCLPDARVSIEVWTTERTDAERQTRVQRFYRSGYKVLFISRHDLTAKDTEDRLLRAIKGALR